MGRLGLAVAADGSCKAEVEADMLNKILENVNMLYMFQKRYSYSGCAH